jgi:hypothetical protein
MRRIEQVRSSYLLHRSCLISFKRLPMRHLLET